MIRAGRAVIALLVVIGVAAAASRTLFLDDMFRRVEPQRRQLFDVMHVNDPFALERDAELARIDGRFAAHPIVTVLHVVPGAVFLLLAPLQFSARMRRRHLRLHRWSGRVLLPIALVSVPGGLYFGVLTPFAPGEAVVIGLITAWFVAAIVTAFVAIRRHDVDAHREWMIRVFATAMAISTIRVIATPLDLLLTPAGFRLPSIFVVTLWTGWLLTLAVAEWWIRRTRPVHHIAAIVEGIA
jgi:uncharacterized membrane protein